MIGNCITFALWRLWTRGGYVLVHRSPRGWWPHVIWSQDLVTFEQFLPKKHRRWYAVALKWRIPPLLFDGKPYPYVPEITRKFRTRRLLSEH